MLLNWKIEVFRRPNWDAEVTVKTWPRKFEKVSSWRDFEVYDKDGNLIVIRNIRVGFNRCKKTKYFKNN